MLIRRATLDDLGGYDETLAYEDFDFWVRAARNWHFYGLDAVTTRKRLHSAAMSRRGYRPNDPYLASTIRVCQKALALCRTPTERAALAIRLRWKCAKPCVGATSAKLRSCINSCNKPPAPNCSIGF